MRCNAANDAACHIQTSLPIGLEHANAIVCHLGCKKSVLGHLCRISDSHRNQKLPDWRRMRYFFHLDNGNQIEDDEGVECKSAKEACEYARQVAFELDAHKPEAPNHLSWIRVTDEDGKEVFRTLLKAKLGS